MASLFRRMLHGTFLTLFVIAAALSPEEVEADVVIIGGGSSGTYAAVRLHDLGKSVIVVEQDDVLGGNTNTYVDPQTNITIDYGVVVFHDILVAQNYFNRLNIPFAIAPMGSYGTTTFANLKEGEVIANFVPSNPTNALAAYGAQVAQYPGLGAGFFLPNPVPEDLVMPFGQFVQKYNLGDAVQIIAGFAQGYGDFLEQMTLNIFMGQGLQVLESMQTGFLIPVHHDNHEIYDNAFQVLGSDKVLLKSKVVSTNRSFADHVEVTVQTPSGLKVINANKLVMAIPPKLDNLVDFDLDGTEQSLFLQFVNTAYYTGLVRNTGLPENTTYQNVDVAAPYSLPDLPGLYGLGATAIPGLLDVKYGSQTAFFDDAVKADIIATIIRLRTNLGIQTDEEPEFVAYNSHTPFRLTVSPDDVKSGFYDKLNALQGHLHTFWTGATFDTPDSALLWNFTETLLPLITA
ncbi:hypothetical protein Egran_02559 [Elaphomyces granulatus]|uniref:Amine oxidase domain-containing protein n=1 Tax=Elaphomyces granulatus TaxID=519963 RepID=A0A232M0Q0_9EURO|nr:hypothetical protein Egran_02559 [Elaphomyces granulatus]